MVEIPRSDPRARYIARNEKVDRAALDEFIRDRYRWILVTTRSDGRPQLSPLTGGLLPDGRLITSTYPERAKVANVRRRSQTSVLVLSDDWNGPWVQVDGSAEVLDLPEALDDFVAYYRSISGEHPDWGEYREAMTEQGKCLIRIAARRWRQRKWASWPGPTGWKAVCSDTASAPAMSIW